jgi:hypothetical protein
LESVPVRILKGQPEEISGSARRWIRKDVLPVLLSFADTGKLGAPLNTEQ